MKPILKWVGSKRWIARDICQIIKSRWSLERNYYFEPFFGGGSVYFELEHPRSIILDKLVPLMEFYKVIASSPVTVYEACVKEVNRGMRVGNYNAARTRFNSCLKRNDYSPEFAALFIYLNKLCYNGLWRQNQNGEYNVPYGKHSGLKAPNASDLILASDLLRATRIDTEGKPDSVYDWLENIERNDVLFADPPYFGTFSGWDGFGGENSKNELQFHTKLARKLCNMVERNVHIVAMNSAHSFIEDKYKNHFEIHKLNHSQNIAPENEKRTNAPQFLMISKN